MNNDYRASLVLLILILILLIYQIFLSGHSAVVEITRIETNTGDISFLTMDATKRASYVNNRSGVFCSEPPPDALADVDKYASLKSAAKARGKAGGEIDLKNNSSLTTKPLFLRSHANQFYRDGMFYLCQTFANGALTRDDYPRQQMMLLHIVEKLFEIELTYNRFYQEATR